MSKMRASDTTTAEHFLQTFIALSKLSSGFEADLVPIDGHDAQKAGHKAPLWVQDPVHRRFGTAA